MGNKTTFKKGHIVPEKTRLKISNTMKGQKKSLNTRQKMRKPKTLQHKINMKLAFKTRPKRSRSSIDKGIKSRQIFYKNHPEKLLEYGKKMKRFWNTPKAIEFAKQRRLNQIFPFKDSKIEKILQCELHNRNIIFKKHVPLIGQPDIFIEPNICIFCDGDYWHANPLKYKPMDILYMEKGIGITANTRQLKDWEVTRKLTEQHYFVIRFWETDILKDIKSIGDKIENLIK